MRMFIIAEINKVRDVLSELPEHDRLQVIAEALCDLNDRKPKGERITQASCGCYEWDISIDYRPHPERYPEKDE